MAGCHDASDWNVAKNNDGAPGIDGVTFEVIETRGKDVFLEQIQGELNRRTYVPLPAEASTTEGWRKSSHRFDSRYPIPDGAGRAEAHTGAGLRGRLSPGSFAYRPKRTAQEAVSRVAQAIVQQKTRVVDIDLRNYFDNVRQDQIAAKGNGACLAWFGVLQNWSIPRTSKARFCNFQWFEGRCEISTYEINEILGSKLWRYISRRKAEIFLTLQQLSITPAWERRYSLDECGQ